MECIGIFIRLVPSLITNHEEREITSQWFKSEEEAFSEGATRIVYDDEHYRHLRSILQYKRLDGSFLFP